jgi:hypothetical protein
MPIVDLVESPVGLRVFISQFVATDYSDTFCGDLGIAGNLRHPCLDAYVVRVSEENASGSYVSDCLAVCVGSSTGLQREASNPAVA